MTLCGTLFQPRIGPRWVGGGGL